MEKQGSQENIVELPIARRRVSLESTDEAIMKLLIFHAMNDKRSLQDCLRETFGPDHLSNLELRNLYMNAGLFDAARESARISAK